VGELVDQWGNKQEIVYPVIIDAEESETTYLTKDTMTGLQFSNPNTTGFVQLKKGDTANFNRNAAFRYIVTFPAVGELDPEWEIDQQRTFVTAKKGGSFHVITGTRVGDFFVSAYQVTDPDAINGYELDTYEAYFTDKSSPAKQIAGTATIENGDIALKDCDQITWSCADTDIATVSATGVVTPQTDSGVTVVRGTFEDAWGVTQRFYVMVVIGENWNDNIDGDLAKWIKKAQEILAQDPKEYEQEGLDDLQQVLDGILENYPDEPSTRPGVELAIEDIKDAIENLVALDKIGALGDALSAYGQLKEEDYTTSSWAASGYEEALQAVLAMLEALQSDQLAYNTDQVGAAIDALKEAAKSKEDGGVLELRADASKFTTLLEELEALNEEDYSIYSWNALQQVITDANLLDLADMTNMDVYGTDDTTGVAAEYGKLLAAKNAMVDLTALQAEYDTSAEIEDEGYTEESWNAFVAARDAAYDLLNSTEEYSAADVETAREALENARLALEEAANDELIAKLNGLVIRGRDIVGDKGARTKKQDVSFRGGSKGTKLTGLQNPYEIDWLDELQTAIEVAEALLAKKPPDPHIGDGELRGVQRSAVSLLPGLTADSALLFKYRAWKERSTGSGSRTSRSLR